MTAHHLPYNWAFGKSPPRDGADWGSLGLLYGISAVALVIGGIVFNHRDVSA